MGILTVPLSPIMNNPRTERSIPCERFCPLIVSCFGRPQEKHIEFAICEKRT